MLPADLVTLLRCAKTHEPLIYFPRGEDGRNEAAGFLVCPGSRLRYRIDAGVPVMLVDEAEELEPAVISRLVSRARSLGLPVPT
ncbi:MAG: Trm112 family protein [Deltaproteobacteria bacterium]|nr:Trm112 family protein [Deltaproteobacteria bacterium]